MKSFKLIVIFTISISVVTTRKHKHVSIPRENNVTDISWKGNNYLEFKGRLRKEFFVNSALSSPDDNTICSPISVLMPLGKLALGAEGQALEELLIALGVSKRSMIADDFKPLITVLQYLPGVKLDIASKLFISVNSRLQQGFMEQARYIFASSAVKIDFQFPTYATEQINSWVSSETNGVIKDILSPSDIPPSSSLILVNAVYFTGKWKKPFEKIFNGTFHTASGKKPVTMMTNIDDFNYTKSKALAAQIILIPYMGEKAKFLLVLPKARNGLSLLLSQLKLAPEILESAMSMMTATKVHLTMPKFKIESSLNLVDMYEKNSALSSPDDNTICSPISVLMPLGKLALGAEGQALEELLIALGVSKRSMIADDFKPLITVLKYLPGVKLDIASKLFISVNSRLQQGFMEQARYIFASSAVKIDFQFPTYATEQINSWVSSETNGVIKDILSPSDIPPSSSLILVNAVYFTGKWKKPFEKIFNGTFHTASGKKPVTMMTNIDDFNYTKSEALAARIIIIPYMGEKAKFLLVLPKARNGLSLLLSQLKLAPEILESAMSMMTATKVHLTMPKFKIESSLNLVDMYEKIGLRQIFDAQDSGLLKIVRDETIYVSSAKHKAFISVNEFGTEAGASSSAGMSQLSNVKSTEFRADHPFLFFIIVNGEQLFSGTYVNPS